MFARIYSYAISRLGRKRQPQPLADVKAALKVQMKRRGPGSEIALAKLQGIRIAETAYRL